jgi:hypothetical protein
VRHSCFAEALSADLSEQHPKRPASHIWQAVPAQHQGGAHSGADFDRLRDAGEALALFALDCLQLTSTSDSVKPDIEDEGAAEEEPVATDPQLAHIMQRAKQLQELASQLVGQVPASHLVKPPAPALAGLGSLVGSFPPQPHRRAPKDGENHDVNADSAADAIRPQPPSANYALHGLEANYILEKRIAELKVRNFCCAWET